MVVDRNGAAARRADGPGLHERLIPPLASGVVAPLSMAAYHALGEVARYRAAHTERVIQRIARGIARVERRRALRFGEVSLREWPAVRRMRRRVYEDSLPSLLRELDAYDQDRYDAHSFLFAAWIDDEPVATVRLTTFPFETLRHVDPAVMDRYLGADWEQDYIEWGRLALDRAYRGRRLMPALATYAGLRLVTETPYYKYLGYSRVTVRARLRGFRFLDDSFTFRIPERGDHDYALLRGDARRDLLLGLPRFAASILASGLDLGRARAAAGA